MKKYQSKVRVIGYTQPAAHFLKEFDASDIVAYCARVSNPSNQMNHETSERLLAYLKKHAHWSPFEMASVTLEIETTRDIARQMLRHRSFSFQEFSQRYADPIEELGFVYRDARLQDPKNRQNSVATDDEEIHRAWELKQAQIAHESMLAYRWAIQNNIAKEQARAVLPEGSTVSRMYMQGTLRSWIHYCDLRRGNGTQLEHQEVANRCFEQIVRIFPTIMQ